jgi:hypothetical protein
MFGSCIVPPAGAARDFSRRSFAPLDAAFLYGGRYVGRSLRELIAVPEHTFFANAQPGAELYPLRPDPRRDPVEPGGDVTEVIVSDASLGVGAHVVVAHAEHVLVEPVYAPKAEHVVLPWIAIEIHLDRHYDVDPREHEDVVPIVPRLEQRHRVAFAQDIG